MTWIVGTVPPFGYSIFVSDIRVTWADGTERDCLQKIHRVGDDFLCGFAGSVRIGFAMLDYLAAQLPVKQHRSPAALATDWIPSLARRVFRSAPAEERKWGCQLIIAAAHPTENLGDAPWPLTYVWTFDDRESFKPKACGFEDAIGIGSGSGVSAYVTALREARRDFCFLDLARLGEAEQAFCLAGIMHRLVLETPTASVSPFFQMALLTRGRATFGNYEPARIGHDRIVHQVSFPPVAQNYRAFKRFCKAGKLSTTGAVG